MFVLRLGVGAKSVPGISPVVGETGSLSCGLVASAP